MSTETHAPATGLDPPRDRALHRAVLASRGVLLNESGVRFLERTAATFQEWADELRADLEADRLTPHPYVPREGNALRCGTCGLAKGAHR